MINLAAWSPAQASKGLPSTCLLHKRHTSQSSIITFSRVDQTFVMGCPYLLQAAEAASSLKYVHTSCPPCEVPVKRTCKGGHVDKMMPCSAAAAFACDQNCGQPLTCGNHTCQKPCHVLASSGGCPGSSWRTGIRARISDLIKVILQHIK